ncbi:hypothetical protein GmHk_19G054698 [Glycine max]|nr:hypothetical protein GmHk_19G054698 [Glycine max]
MESVFALVYCNGNMIPSFKGILFECPSGPQVVTISDHISKGLIELNANFGQSLDEILALMHKPMKPRSVDEIIALMRVKSA